MNYDEYLTYGPLGTAIAIEAAYHASGCAERHSRLAFYNLMTSRPFKEAGVNYLFPKEVAA